MNPRYYFLSALLVFLLPVTVCTGQITRDSLSRKVALLDFTQRNAESNDGEIFSARYILKTAGLPFFQTTNVDSACRYKIIITSSKLDVSTLTTPEKDSLIDFVNAGGVLIAPSVRDPYFYSVFGISANAASSSHNRIFFRMFMADPSFKWLNDSMEQTISLGDTTYPTTLNTRQYTTAGALSLAEYEDQTVAVTKNFYGAGRAYALGFTFKNVIANFQLNRDPEANRVYSNGFEPTTDAIMLFLKGIYLDIVPRSVWLHTSPFNSQSTLMITHDVDASSAYDTMHYYSDFEQSVGLKASYFFTTHYLGDGYLSDFYNMANIPKVQYVLNQGHVGGSHSVGHFPDFDDETVFPLGGLGNQQSTYAPYNNGTGGATTAGTVIAEVEVSKDILFSDFGITAKTFRAGHLLFNDKLINALDTTGYVNNTTFPAGDILTNFPFQQHKDRSVNGVLSNVWEFPMTISDVFSSNSISSSNYPQKVAIWLDVIKKNMANNAPNVLLIHPTKLFKLYAEQDLMDSLPTGVFVTNLEYFADYWRTRNTISFESFISNDTLTIVVPTSMLPLDSAISFVVDSGQFLAYVKAQDDAGNPIAVIQSPFNQHDLILHFSPYPQLSLGLSAISNTSELPVKCFPNPAADACMLEFLIKNEGRVQVELTDLSGNSLFTAFSGYCERGWYQQKLNIAQLASGIYFIKLSLNGQIHVRKLIVSR